MAKKIQIDNKVIEVQEEGFDTKPFDSETVEKKSKTIYAVRKTLHARYVLDKLTVVDDRIVSTESSEETYFPIIVREIMKKVV